MKIVTVGALVRLVPPMSSPLMFVESVYTDQPLALCGWWTERHGMQREALPLAMLRVVATAGQVLETEG